MNRCRLFGAALGAVIAAIPVFAQPVNDECTNALPVTAGNNAFDTTLATTSSGVVVSCRNSTSKDIWFTYTAPNAGVAVFDTCDSTFNTVLSVYTACGGTELACNNDGGGCENATRARVVLKMSNGETVLIRLAGRSAPSGGTGFLNITAPGPSLIIGDECENAQIVGAGNTSFNTASATTSGNIAMRCFHDYEDTTITKDIWFEYIAPQSGSCIITAETPGVYSVLTTYSECGGSVLDEGDSSNNEFKSRNAVHVNENQVIKVRVSVFSRFGVDTSANGVLHIDAPVSGVVNDTCVTALEITEPGLYPVDMTYAATTPLSFDPAVNNCFIHALYYNYVAPANIEDRIEFYARVPLSVGHEFSIMTFDELCNIDSRSPVSLYYAVRYLTAEQAAHFAVFSLNYLFLPSPKDMTIIANPVSVWDEAVDGGGDAGDLPTSAQVVTGSGILDRIVGQQSSNKDFYKIEICDHEAFVASTVTTNTFPGSDVGAGSLSLYDQSGNLLVDGVQTDGQGFIAYDPGVDGIYYLCVNESSLAATSNVYRIALTGVCRVNEMSCPADFNHVNGVTVQDIFDFLTAWLAGNNSADFNHVNGVTVQDIFDFLTAWLAGC